MEIYEIETFLMIANTRSISKAAQRMFLSQSAVTHRLQSLEKELDTVLFERKRGQRSIELTSKGVSFISVAEHWLSVLHDTEVWKSAPSSIRLNIGGLETINTYVLFSIIKEISEESEDLIFDVRIRSKANGEIYDLMYNHEIDIGFVTTIVPQNSIKIAPIFKERYKLLYPDRDYDQSNKPVSLHSLDKNKELFVAWSTDYQIWHNEFFGLKNRPKINLDIIPLVIQFLINSRYWMIAPATVAESISTVYHMKIYPITESLPFRVCYKLEHKSTDTGKKIGLEIFTTKLSRLILDNPLLLPVSD
jgi:DNA-binding transcriptional LysR family regulator